MFVDLFKCNLVGSILAYIPLRYCIDTGIVERHSSVEFQLCPSSREKRGIYSSRTCLFRKGTGFYVNLFLQIPRIEDNPLDEFGDFSTGFDGPRGQLRSCLESIDGELDAITEFGVPNVWKIF